MANSEDRIEDLKRSIPELTRQHWEKTRKALLLASLGQTLRRAGHDLKVELRGQKMVPFLLMELADKVKILQSPFDKLVYGIVPVDADTGDAGEPLFARERGKSEEKAFRFDRRVWLAFSRPVAPGFVRALFWEPELGFEDISKQDAEKVPNNIVPEELIIPVGKVPSDERNAVLQQNIREWFEKRGVNIEVARSKVTQAAGVLIEDGSALAALIQALDPRDLSRISMPLDIIAKLVDAKMGRKR